MGLVIIAISVFLILFVFYMLNNAFQDNVKEETLEFYIFPNNIREFTIFFISDIHRRKINSSIIDQVKGKADAVIIGGDLTEKGVPYSRVSKNLKMLKDVAPVFFVWGNNDYEVNNNQLSRTLKNCQVIELKNEVYYIEKNEQKLAFIGVDDLTQELPPLEDILKQEGRNVFRILISHNPDIIHMLPEEHGISLILSGHTHGGQIRVFGFGPYRKGGIRNIKGLTLLVSNGYGTTALPLRLGADAETHLITIKNGKGYQA
ncbi:metallophosphoesterase [Lederbergia citrea]|uniref:metallophosphoesterase n=1 Tax=Lederbergia citrea TaxID=2833581 RepID=UPI001BCA6325|nr:metallophosphoesterase [Lederbergia citrea]MBS4176541.1 metallophosphoesterase [Lederbergia citrea]